MKRDDPALLQLIVAACLLSGCEKDSSTTLNERNYVSDVQALQAYCRALDPIAGNQSDEILKNLRSTLEQLDLVPDYEVDLKRILSGMDRWGRPILLYRDNAENLCILSTGEDGLKGTQDDLVQVLQIKK